MLDVAMRKVFKIKESADTLFFLIWMFWTNFMENCQLYIPYQGIISKNECTFLPSKDLKKHVTPSQRDPPANEVTEPLAFTVCKVEPCSEAIVLQSHFRPVVDNNQQNWTKAMVMCNGIKRFTEEELPKAWL